MAALRNYYNYRRLTKPPARQINHAALPKEAYHITDHIATPPAPDDILLRTARAERALYTHPHSRMYDGQAGPAAVSANNVGVRCLDYDLPRAFRNFMDALELAPEFALAHNNLGLAYIQIGAIHQAIHHLDQALVMDESLDIAFTNRGLGHLEIGEYECAFRDFGNALCIDRHDPMHHNNMGVLWLDTNRPETALAWFEQAISLNPEHPIPWRNRGYAYRELDDHETSVSSFEKASQLETHLCPLPATVD